MAEPLQTSENNRTQAELTPLLEITNHDEFTEQSQIFLEQRLAQLEATPTVPQIDASLGNFQGFIAPTTVVSPWALGKGYKLDDPSMYANLLPNMKSYYQAYAQVVDDPAKAYRNAALATAQHTQQSYFGNVHSGNGGGGARESLLDDYVDDESPAVRSIAEFKGVAMCAERAAVANNALQVLGISPVLEMGSWESETHTSPEQHAYLFFRDGKGNHVLYDPTNPTLTFDENEELVRADPAIYMVGDANTFREAGQPIVVDHKTRHITTEGVQTTTEKYRYGLNAMGSDIHPS